MRPRSSAVLDGGGSHSVMAPSTPVTPLVVRSNSACSASWADSNVTTAYCQALSERIDLKEIFRGIF